MARKSRKSGRTGISGAAVAITAMVFAVVAAPAFGQGLATLEPTLGECRSFVAEKGVPETRPVWENRGYSGWDVCLSMAYDGDMEGSFASADVDGDGRLGASEQSAYMDSVIGSVSGPDRSPLTLDKCAAMVSEHGIPAERPFVDWSNRGYGDAEVCQSLAFDGSLGSSFAAADSNGDGRLDRAEQSSYIASLAAPSDEAASDETASQPESPISEARNESVVRGKYGTNAAEEQYGSAGDGSAGDGNAGVEETTAIPVEPTISAVSDGAATKRPADSTDAARSDEATEPETGVLSAMNDAVQKLLPDTGGIPILSVLGGFALVAGGLLAYRLRR
ncbi:hypothetical protein BH20ACT10_BH20ACT10_19360 [soil metagenome]